MKFVPLIYRDNIVEQRNSLSGTDQSSSHHRRTIHTFSGKVIVAFLATLILAAVAINATEDVKSKLERQSKAAADATWQIFVKNGVQTTAAQVGALIIGEFKPKSNLNALTSGEIRHLSDFYHGRMDTLLQGTFEESARRPILDKARKLFKIVLASPNNW